MIAKENVRELTSGEFSSLLNKEKDKLVLVDFYAEWCMPCLMMAPILESMASQYAGSDKKDKVIFTKINVDESRELSQKYNISSIPCLIFFKQGQEIDKIIGAVSEEQIQEKINENL